MRNMTVFLTLLVFMFLGSSGTDVTTPAQDRCSIHVFENCTDAFTSLMNITDNEITFDREGLLNFYCGSNFTDILQCLKDHLDPTCGPDTAAAIINRTLSAAPSNFSYDKFCQNKTEFNDLLSCQTLFPKLQGYVDCVTGVTLNKTVDPTDPCSLLNTTMGCSFKYTKIMCPNSTNAFIDYSKNTGSCNVDFENSPEATSCDVDIEKACFVAFTPPSIDSNVTEFTQFICSERSRELQKCLRRVFAMCKDETGYNTSTITTDIEFYETQTAMFCSSSAENDALKKCQEMFPKVSAFQDCITGETLNKTLEPADSCNFLQNSLACAYKYMDLMCPESLDVFNATVAFPENCQKNSKMSKAVKTCDSNMSQACGVAFNPPLTKDPDEYIAFICSGRARGYKACRLKVQKLCAYSDTDVTEELEYHQQSENYEAVMCGDSYNQSKKAYLECFMNYTVSDEYLNCTATLEAYNTCRIHNCSLPRIRNMCPSSEEFYKRLHYNELVDCNIMSATTTLGTVDISTSSSTSIEVPVVALFGVAWNMLITFTRFCRII